MLNLSLTYRTAEGNLVRGLRYHYRDQVAIINGQARRTGVKEKVILGEVKMYDETSETVEWCEVTWNERGQEIYGSKTLDLVEHKEPEVKQPQLF